MDNTISNSHPWLISPLINSNSASTVASANQTQIADQKKTLVGLPAELLILLLKNLPLRNLVGLRVINKLFCKIIDDFLFKLFSPSGPFDNATKMHEFLCSLPLQLAIRPAWIKYFYTLVFPKIIQADHSSFKLKGVLESKQFFEKLEDIERPEDNGILNELVRLGLLTQPQRERLAQHPAHARFIKTKESGLQLALHIAQGTQPDWEAFLTVPEDHLVGGILAVLRNPETDGQAVIVSAMVQSQLFVNRVERTHYWTPLHLATAGGLLPAVEFLITAGADKEARDVQGQTPLHYAAYNHRTEIARSLIEQGACVNARNTAGRTALHHAVKEGDLELTQLLLANGAAVDRQNNKGFTALHLAAHKGNARMMEILRAQDADASMQN